MNPLAIALTFFGIYLFIILAAFIGIYRECRRKLKQIDHAHKMESTTLPEPDSIPWRELGMEYDEYPYVKLL